MNNDPEPKASKSSVFGGLWSILAGGGGGGRNVRFVQAPHVKVAPLRAAADAPKIPVFSLVPESQPIKLIDYYDSFANYYVEAELQTKRWLVRNCRPEWIALDIGANVGLYSILLSRLLTSGCVHSFEPTTTLTKLRSNLKEAHCSNVITYQLAMGSQVGSKEEPIYRIWGSDPEVGNYNFTTVDDFAASADLKRIDLVKIDVDGFDLEVLKGAESILQRFNPWVLIELNHALNTRGQSANQALMWLQSQGYDRAFVMDEENFLLRKSENPTSGLTIEFDREPVVLPPAFAPGKPLENAIGDDFQLHNSAEIINDYISCQASRWSYAASWPAAEGMLNGPTIITLEVKVESGSVGFGCVGQDFETYLGKEVYIDSASSEQVARINVPDGSSVRYLVARNVHPSGIPFQFRVVSISAAPAIPTEHQQSAVMRWETNSFSIREVSTSEIDENDRIEIVNVQDIGTALGFKNVFFPEKIVYRYGVGEFKTEIDEPGIYRYIYRNLNPLRHLEFGTWEGFGAVLCASSCDAHIWTINLPEGERDQFGAAVYSRQALADSQNEKNEAGDAGDRIGWRYRAAGYGSRVTQILCDSREFASEQFDEGFFDSILIDGGHTAEVMASDTDKAIRLLRSGGLMIWHDFCPDPTALALSEAGRGVMDGWIANHSRWRPHFSRLFWVRPSWLLVGVKR